MGRTPPFAQASDLLLDQPELDFAKGHGPLVHITPRSAAGASIASPGPLWRDVGQPPVITNLIRSEQ